MPKPPGYRPPARALHWLVALAVLSMIPAGLVMTREGIPRPLQDALFLFHKNLGTLLIPVILVYTGYSYWVFRGKIGADAGYH